MKRIIFFLLFLMFCPSAFADTSIIIGPNFAPSTSATRYAPVSGNIISGKSTQSSSDVDSQLFTTAGTITKMQVVVSAAPGTGKSWAVTVMENNSPSSMTCTISDAETSCLDATNALTVTAADRYEIKVVPTGTPTVANMRVYFGFNSTTNNESVMAGSSEGDTVDYGSTTYLGLSGDVTPGTTESSKWTVMPTGGTIKNLYIRFPTNTAAGSSFVFTVRKNAEDTTLTCTVGAAASTCNDTTHTVAVVAGDYVTISAAATGTPGYKTIKWGATFAATTRGDFPLLVSSVSLGTTATQYIHATGGGTGVSTTENFQYGLSGALTLKNINVVLSAAPGAGTTRTFTVRQDKQDTALATTISEAGTTGSDTGTISVTDLQTLGYSSALTGSPAAATFHAAMTGFISQGDAPAPAAPTLKTDDLLIYGPVYIGL